MKTFNITVEMLQAKGACMEGMRDFLTAYPKETYPDGVDYQELLDACAQHDRDNDAEWMLNAFGRVAATLKLDGINSEKSIFFAGSIVVKGAIICKKHIRSGSGIEAGEGIEAGWGIEAGEGIKAGDGIKAGEGIKAGWGIEAGEGIKAGDGIEAGSGIKAGWGIEAGSGIEAGEGIEAGWGIEAGEDYGIYAGLRIRISLKGKYALIKAKKRPENIVCGEYAGGGKS